MFSKCISDGMSSIKVQVKANCISVFYISCTLHIERDTGYNPGTSLLSSRHLFHFGLREDWGCLPLNQNFGKFRLETNGKGIF